jgi:hypothetical protein
MAISLKATMGQGPSVLVIGFDYRGLSPLSRRDWVTL